LSCRVGRCKPTASGRSRAATRAAGRRWLSASSCRHRTALRAGRGRCRCATRSCWRPWRSNPMIATSNRIACSGSLPVDGCAALSSRARPDFCVSSHAGNQARSPPSLRPSKSVSNCRRSLSSNGSASPCVTAPKRVGASHASSASKGQTASSPSRCQRACAIHPSGAGMRRHDSMPAAASSAARHSRARSHNAAACSSACAERNGKAAARCAASRHSGSIHSSPGPSSNKCRAAGGMFSVSARAASWTAPWFAKGAPLHCSRMSISAAIGATASSAG